MKAHGVSQDERVRLAGASAGTGEVPPACDRADLTRWSAEGGPLPRRLADHVRSCDGCAAQVRRVNRVHASLSLLKTQPLPARTHARANGAALRMLRRAARASEAARRLLRHHPRLGWWQRAQLHTARLSCAAAAAALLLVIRAGILSGSERTEALRDELAGRYWAERVDPMNNWDGPRHLT